MHSVSALPTLPNKRNTTRYALGISGAIGGCICLSMFEGLVTLTVAMVAVTTHHSFALDIRRKLRTHTVPYKCPWWDP